MKKLFKVGFLALAVGLYSCGGSDSTGEDTPVNPNNPNAVSNSAASSDDSATNDVPPSERVDMSTKGVGPISSITIADEIDDALAKEGEEIYVSKCTACHKADKTFIGPAPKGILERRTPEWVMNMILNPTEMVQQDALAKELLEEFNGSPMSNQGLTEDDARAVLEYIRTL